MLTINILDDIVEITGDLESLPKTINLDIVEQSNGKITILDPVPFRKQQVANAAIKHVRDLYDKD